MPTPHFAPHCLHPPFFSKIKSYCSIYSNIITPFSRLLPCVCVCLGPCTCPTHSSLWTINTWWNRGPTIPPSQTPNIGSWYPANHRDDDPCKQPQHRTPRRTPRQNNDTNYAWQNDLIQSAAATHPGWYDLEWDSLLAHPGNLPEC